MPPDRSPALAALAARGQSIWVDMLSRGFVASGELGRLVAEDSVTGLTSNPTIFEKAIAGGGYDDRLQATAQKSNDPREIFFALAIDDVRAACDVFAPVYDSTGGADGYVSLEVDPGLAHESEATLAQALDLHQRVERPNVLIKIPATREGLPAIEDCIARGVSINVTLIFSLGRYGEVVSAYQRGLTRLLSDGGDLANVRSVASFFISRLDSEADRLLEQQGNHALQGRLGVDSGKLVYARFGALFAGPAWDRLAAAGATKQRPLWASTSTKNPAYRDTMYVEELVGPDTVNTMPPETLAAFRDHGVVRGDTLEQGLVEAEQLLQQLQAAGVSYDAVVTTLEQEGVAKFADSFDSLIAGIEAKQRELAAA
jgi:transaldolase